MSGWVIVAIVAIVVDVPLLARLSPGTTQTDAAFELVRFLVAVPVGAVAGGVALRRLGPGVVAAPGLLLAGICLFVMAGWDRTSLADTVPTTIVLVLAGLGVGLAIAPVNDAALADAVEHAHGTVSSLVVVARMVGMVVGLALLTGIGLNRYYAAIEALPPEQRTSGQALIETAMVQVETVFLGAALAAGLGAVIALLMLGRTPEAVRHEGRTVGL